VPVEESDTPVRADTPAAPAVRTRNTPVPPRLSVAVLWVAGLAGVAAALASRRPWVRAALADRGADLLVVTRSGWDLHPAGQVVCALGLLVTLACVLADTSRPSWWVGCILPVSGVAIAAFAVSRLHAGEPMARKLTRLRIGTFQTDHPVATGGPAAGLWLTLAAGVVIAVAGVGWLALDRKVRRARASTPAGGHLLGP
jgi:hypothetical protein